MSKIEMKSQRATAINVAERQRSRNEADTGRKTSSAIRRIAGLGRSDAIAVRGRRAEDERVENWAELLRPAGSPGLRAGPSAHPRSAQPEHDKRFGQTFAVRRTAPGFRERANGVLSNVGTYGFSYSSSVSGSNGVYLDFNVTHLYSSFAYPRGYGFQLRCLSE